MHAPGGVDDLASIYKSASQCEWKINPYTNTTISKCVCVCLQVCLCVYASVCEFECVPLL